ncbi:MAG: 2-oxoacid:ferredoxin oxidoreductase subunit beta [Candidatus Heimdallarchaeota archaeon]|nr:2-oxoacid:ferredoxin oxidoreductase subunit beta [Candidatus Heimdallarchaeota archaeon]
MNATKVAERHPNDSLIRIDRLPHIWCPGCGLGNILGAYAKAVDKDETPRNLHAVVSGIGCSGRAAGYMNLDSYHATHGRAIPFASGIKLANKDLKVTVISGDGDLSTIGGNHIIHAARRNMDITVIFNNNFIYGMTGGQYSATTPHGAYSSTSQKGNFERPFNMSLLMKAAGATYVARWTALHLKQLEKSIQNALAHRGFSFIEVVSPCPTGFGRKNKFKDALDSMKYYEGKSEVQETVDLESADLSMDPLAHITVGEFYSSGVKDYMGVKMDFLKAQGVD